MKAKAITRDSKRISDALSQCQAQLNEAVLTSVESQRTEAMRLVSDTYDMFRQKVQQLFAKGAQTQQKLNHQVSNYKARLTATGNNLPGQITRTVRRHPWVALTVVLIVSAAVGFLVKPSHEAE
ncbi:MAG: hypothetical protein KJ077_05390 [Anaerolineae bacterium]|nr:hypothetical protein [Anaerolineae bacterium]